MSKTINIVIPITNKTRIVLKKIVKHIMSKTSIVLRIGMSKTRFVLRSDMSKTRNV